MARNLFRAIEPATGYVAAVNLDRNLQITDNIEMARVFEGTAWEEWVLSKGLRVEPLDKKVYFTNGLPKSHWRHYADEFNLDTLWLIPSRDAGKPHAKQFHGLFVPQIPRQFIRRYTSPGDVVLDLFNGSGTTVIEALKLSRHGIGIDLNQEFLDDTRTRIEGSNLYRKWWRLGQLMTADSTNYKSLYPIAEVIKNANPADGYADLVFLHPPYGSIIQFSKSQFDLSAKMSPGQFMAYLKVSISMAYTALRPGRHAVLVIGDIYQNKQTIPLGAMSVTAALETDFLLKSMIVKDIQGAETGGRIGKNQNLWKRRAVEHGFHLFKHEYILLLQKPFD